ncbi:sensor histidine kinase [Flavobacterium ponti]|uniref:Oxygen sensor histidine kinase NreB n=1 Tax=Flavobacterium ponti TaxID=665133 RepID=A0ABV9P6U5_9FLAO
MKKQIFWLLVSIALHFVSCEKPNDINKQSALIDSIVYYNQEIRTSNYPDSVKKILNDKVLRLNGFNKNDSIRIKNNDTIAYNYYKLDFFNEYKDVAKRNLIESIKTKDTSRIIKSTINYGHYFLRNNIKDSAYFYFDKAQQLYVLNNQIFESNDLSVQKASIQYYNGDYLGSETTILKSLSFLKKKNDVIKLNVAYSIVGLCKIELKDFDEAIYYLKLALELANNIDDDDISISIALNNLGLVYFKKEDYSKAIEYYAKAIKIKDFKKNNFQIYTYAKQNLILSRFYNGGQNNVEEEFNEIIENYNELNLSLALPKIQLSEYFFRQNQLKKSQESALEAYNISVNKNAFRDKLISLKQLTNVFPEKAKYYSNEYIKLSDSIAAVDKKIQNTFARIEYRVDELNNENEVLAQQNKQIIYYALIGILLFTLGFVYFWQKQKQKQLLFENNQQKSNEQIYQLMLDQQVKYEEGRTIEKQRIAKELHDGVMNKLAAIRFNLYALKRDRTDKTIVNCLTYVDEIQTVEKEIRTLSHDLSKEVFEKSNNFEAIIQAIYWNNDEDTTKISYHFDPKIKWETFSAEAKLNCYRIIQESIINCLKYAQAKNCSVSLTLEDTVLVIKISDDGIGLDTQKVKSGIGLKNIKERATFLKGKFKIFSTTNQGTTLFINIPINKITV